MCGCEWTPALTLLGSVDLCVCLIVCLWCGFHMRSPSVCWYVGLDVHLPLGFLGSVDFMCICLCIVWYVGVGAHLSLCS